MTSGPEHKKGRHLVQMTPFEMSEHSDRYHGLSLDHVAGLGPLGAFSDVELNEVPLGQRLESFALNGRKMHKDIIAILALDKAEALGVVKPLHLAFCQLISPPFYLGYSVL